MNKIVSENIDTRKGDEEGKAYNFAPGFCIMRMRKIITTLLADDVTETEWNVVAKTRMEVEKGAN